MRFGRLGCYWITDPMLYLKSWCFIVYWDEQLTGNKVKISNSTEGTTTTGLPITRPAYPMPSGFRGESGPLDPPKARTQSWPAIPQLLRAGLGDRSHV